MVLQQERNMRRRPHAQPVGDPLQRHRRLSPQTRRESMIMSYIQAGLVRWVRLVEGLAFPIEQLG
jgi:hypothetical protein